MTSPDYPKLGLKCGVEIPQRNPFISFSKEKGKKSVDGKERKTGIFLNKILPVV
jgi:hypothetical protein